MKIIKVSTNSRTAAVAGAIAAILREQKLAEVQSIGAGAVNRLLSIIIAKSYLAKNDLGIVLVPEFVDVDIDGKTRTAIKLTIMTQPVLQEQNSALPVE